MEFCVNFFYLVGNQKLVKVIVIIVMEVPYKINVIVVERKNQFISIHQMMMMIPKKKEKGKIVK